MNFEIKLLIYMFFSFFQKKNEKGCFLFHLHLHLKLRQLLLSILIAVVIKKNKRQFRNFY